MKRWERLIAAGVAFWACPGFAQEPCAAGTLFEPYTQICAPVHDVRDQFLPLPGDGASNSPLASNPANESDQGLNESRTLTEAAALSQEPDLPVPGGLSVGTTYRELPAVSSGRLHTKMFVHPEGLQPDGPLPLLYTTATSHIHHGLEVLAAYSSSNPGGGRLWLYAWPCLPDYACPDGDTSPGWQWFRELSSLGCNITQVVDQGGHAQKQLYYANHTDKLDEGMPPLWKSAVYLWNYCDDAWDLAWVHTYREAKVDCSVPGSGCAWWGPGIETFGNEPYPQIAELGYEESLLYHDGAWSELRWPEAGFRDPAVWATSTPWVLFHLDPNRGYGVGNSIELNDAPAIDAQQPLQVLEDEMLIIEGDSLDISDPNVDPAYHVEFDLTLYGGDNYSHDGLSVTPDSDYFGTLMVPATVSDGAADSAPFNLRISVIPVNDPPVITGQSALETLERTPLAIDVQAVNVADVDNDAADLTIAVLDGDGYQVMDNTITPDLGVVGELKVPVVSRDGEAESEPFLLLVVITPDVVPPELTLLGPSSVSLFVGEVYRDAGAQATDALDGVITDRIVTENSVNTSRAATYTVIYTVADLAGNSTSATRTVTVKARPSSGGGGGGVDPLLVLLLVLLLAFAKAPATDN